MDCQLLHNSMKFTISLFKKQNIFKNSIDFIDFVFSVDNDV